MREAAGYAVLTLAIVAGAVGLLWSLLTPSGRTGIVVAAVVAWPVQVVSFTVLLAVRDRPNGFLAAWVGGTLVRMGLIAVAAVVVARRPDLPPVPTLLALAGFLFVTLLMEPIFFRPTGRGGSAPGGAAGTEAGS